jgi:hypothetical protein
LLPQPKEKKKMKAMRARYVGDDSSIVGKMFLSDLQRVSLDLRFYEDVMCSTSYVNHDALKALCVLLFSDLRPWTDFQLLWDLSGYVIGRIIAELSKSRRGFA